LSSSGVGMQADPEALAILDDGGANLSDFAERLDFIAPKVGKLLGNRVVTVDPNDPIAVSKARAAIKDRHDLWAENRIDKTGAGDGTPVIAVLRISELERYLRLRYGTVLPDDHAGREDLVILLNHVAHNRTDRGGKMLGFVQRWAPWMPPNESEALIAMILAKPRKYSPKRLGELLRLTEAERRQLCITTIRAFDATDESMAENAKRKDRERKAAFRAANKSGRPRGRPKSEGVPAWVAAGASSKATYYRNLKAGTSETENASEALEGSSYAPDGIKVSPVQSVSPAFERGAPEAPPSPPPRPIVIRLDAIPDDGLILDEDGHEYNSPPPQRRPAPKTWMDAAFEGYNGGRS
jgi:hypothetical protein